MLLNNESLLKGPFWLISEDDEDYLVAYPIEASAKTPSHKEIWDFYRGNIKRTWNYYPRGRVEIKTNKAIVFANPLCFECINLRKMLKEKFNLGETPIEFKADNSSHYTDGVFGINNTTHKKEHSKCRK